MKRITSRFIGVTLVFGGILGMLLSIAGIITIWRIKPKLESQIMEGLSLIARTVETSQSLLSVMDNTLVQVSENLATIQETSSDVALMLENTATTTSSLSQMVSAEFVDVINHTTEGLKSAQRSAKVIDDMITFLAQLPLIGNPNYKSGTPLNVGLQSVSKSLEPLPLSFTSLGQDLETTSQNLSAIQTSLAALTTSLDKIETELTQAQTVVDSYQKIVTELDTKIQKLQISLPNTITWIFIAITTLLAWLIIAQLGLITQGFERLVKIE